MLQDTENMVSDSLVLFWSLAPLTIASHANWLQSDGFQLLSLDSSLSKSLTPMYLLINQFIMVWILILLT